MSRKVRIIVECEDALHRSFATRFLETIAVPSGKSPEISVRDGKDGVLSSAASRIKATRKPVPETHLILIVDGDNWSGEKIRAEIDKRLNGLGEPPLSNADRVLLIVPRWQMDTWVRHLRGETVTEAQGGAMKVDRDSEARVPAQTLAEHCRNHRPLKGPLPSLEAACQEWQAYRTRHGL